MEPEKKLNLITNYFNKSTQKQEKIPENFINQIDQINQQIEKKQTNINQNKNQEDTNDSDEDISHQTSSFSNSQEINSSSNSNQEEENLHSKSEVVQKNKQNLENLGNKQNQGDKQNLKQNQNQNKIQLTASEKIEKIKKQETYYNYLFYSNKIQSFPNGNYIDSIHKNWAKNYELMERHHGYVQWLFPNHYASRFNSSAQKLLKEESNLFKNDKEIAERQIKSYKMFLDFLGIQITNLETGEMARTKHYKERFHKTLLTSWHNHMRVTRLLAHFSVTGFRKYAEQLVKFLEKEIYGQLTFQGYLKNPKIEINSQIAGLKDLAKHTKIFREWQTYAKIDTQSNNSQFKIQKLEENCFESYKVIEQESVFFQKFTKIQEIKKAKEVEEVTEIYENKKSSDKQEINENKKEKQQDNQEQQINNHDHDLF